MELKILGCLRVSVNNLSPVANSAFIAFTPATAVIDRLVRVARFKGSLSGVEAADIGSINLWMLNPCSVTSPGMLLGSTRTGNDVILSELACGTARRASPSLTAPPLHQGRWLSSRGNPVHRSSCVSRGRLLTIRCSSPLRRVSGCGLVRCGFIKVPLLLFHSFGNALSGA